MEHLLPLLTECLSLQAQGGADALCLFDTAAGELSLHDYQTFVQPVIRQLTKNLKTLHPDKKIIYYSKFTHLSYLTTLEDEFIDVLAIDWRWDFAQALKVLAPQYYVQGNMDPAWLFLPWEQLEKNLTLSFSSLKKQDLAMERWIFGLGHGVLPATPEDNVRRVVEWVHRHLRY
jgi:uroporphyrinogen decarboxylase